MNQQKITRKQLIKNVTDQLRWIDVELWERNQKMTGPSSAIDSMYRPPNPPQDYYIDYYIQEIREKLYGISLLTEKYRSIWSWRKI